MRGRAASVSGSDKRKQVHFSALVEDGLWRFDHQLDAEHARIELQSKFEARAEIGERGNFLVEPAGGVSRSHLARRREGNDRDR